MTHGFFLGLSIHMKPLKGWAKSVECIAVFFDDDGELEAKRLLRNPGLTLSG